MLIELPEEQGLWGGSYFVCIHVCGQVCVRCAHMYSCMNTGKDNQYTLAILLPPPHTALGLQAHMQPCLAFYVCWTLNSGAYPVSQLSSPQRPLVSHIFGLSIPITRLNSLCLIHASTIPDQASPELGLHLAVETLGMEHCSSLPHPTPCRRHRKQQSVSAEAEGLGDLLHWEPRKQARTKLASTRSKPPWSIRDLSMIHPTLAPLTGESNG